jgi:hypothetical protein
LYNISLFLYDHFYVELPSFPPQLIYTKNSTATKEIDKFHFIVPQEWAKYRPVNRWGNPIDQGLFGIEP